MRLLAGLLFLLVALPAAAGYAPVYHAPTHQAEYRQQVIAIPVAPDYYYSVGTGERDDAIARKVIEAIRKEFVTEHEAAAAARAPAEGDETDFRVVGKRGPLEAQVARLLEAHCMACHKPGSAKPGLPLLTADRKPYKDPDPAREAARRARVYESVESGDMPKNAPGLSPAQKSLLKRWAKSKR